MGLSTRKFAEWSESTVCLPASVTAAPGRARIGPCQRGIAQVISDPGIERGLPPRSTPSKFWWPAASARGRA